MEVEVAADLAADPQMAEEVVVEEAVAVVEAAVEAAVVEEAVAEVEEAVVATLMPGIKEQAGQQEAGKFSRPVPEIVLDLVPKSVFAQHR